MLKCSVLFIMKEIIIFMTACKLVIGNYKGLYNANIWMSAALWGISGNALFLLSTSVLILGSFKFMPTFEVVFPVIAGRYSHA